jgi:hypothetical protein
MRSSSNNIGNTHRVPPDDPADVPYVRGPTTGDHVVNGAGRAPPIDPEASDPYVQQNAKAGFQTGVIRITPHKYETVMAVRAEGGPSTA